MSSPRSRADRWRDEEPKHVIPQIGDDMDEFERKLSNVQMHLRQILTICITILVSVLGSLVLLIIGR